MNKYPLVIIILVITIPFILFIVVLVVVIQLVSQLHNQKLNYSINSFMNLCVSHPSEKDINSLVWLHRAKASGTTFIDGSIIATDFLVEGGITHFDIDVTVLNHPRTKSPLYLVAHPSQLLNISENNIIFDRIPNQSNAQDEKKFGESKTLSQYSTLSDFLLLITTRIVQSLGELPFITIEPKFSDLNSIQHLVGIIASSSLCNQCAIIVNSHAIFKMVQQSILYTIQ